MQLGTFGIGDVEGASSIAAPLLHRGADQDPERSLERRAVDRGLERILLCGEQDLALSQRSLALAQRRSPLLHLPFEHILAHLERLQLSRAGRFG
jgi:hypothetical protein